MSAPRPASPPSSWPASMPRARRCSCGRSAAAGSAGCRWSSSSAASTPISTWALWRRDVAATIEADDLRAVLARLAGRADLLMLAQPAADLGRHHQSLRAAAAPALRQLRLFRRAHPRFRSAAARAHQFRHAQEDAQEGARARQLRRRALRAGRERRRGAPRARRLLQAEERAHARARHARRLRRRPACAASSRRRPASISPAASR